MGERTRKCVASGETLPEAELVRFALGPGAIIVPDVASKLPGRGVWVKAERDSLEQAIRRGGFARSLKTAVNVPSDLSQQTEALLCRRCLDFLGHGMRAGALAVGTVQVEDAIRKAAPPWLIEAEDGAADGRGKMARLYFGLWGEEPRLVGCFSSQELGVALGRGPVVHLAMLSESMAQRWSTDIGRLAGFRAITPPSWR
jgi:uncharacterized protein